MADSDLCRFALWVLIPIILTFESGSLPLWPLRSSYVSLYPDPDIILINYSYGSGFLSFCPSVLRIRIYLTYLSLYPQILDTYHFVLWIRTFVLLSLESGCLSFCPWDPDVCPSVLGIRMSVLLSLGSGCLSFCPLNPDVCPSVLGIRMFVLLSLESGCLSFCHGIRISVCSSVYGIQIPILLTFNRWISVNSFSGYKYQLNRSQDIFEITICIQNRVGFQNPVELISSIQMPNFLRDTWWFKPFEKTEFKAIMVLLKTWSISNGNCLLNIDLLNQILAISIEGSRAVFW